MAAEQGEVKEAISMATAPVIECISRHHSLPLPDMRAAEEAIRICARCGLRILEESLIEPVIVGFDADAQFFDDHLQPIPVRFQPLLIEECHVHLGCCRSPHRLRQRLNGYHPPKVNGVP